MSEAAVELSEISHSLAIADVIQTGTLVTSISSTVSIYAMCEFLNFTWYCGRVLNILKA
jgi:hypothetical protein